MEGDTRGLRCFSKMTIIIAAVLLVFSLPANGAIYSLVNDPFADASLSTPVSGPGGEFPASLRWRPVTLNPVIASPDALVPGDVITLNLFTDVVLTATVDRAGENVNGTVTVRGRIENHPLGYLIISTSNNHSLGSIDIPDTGQRYRIQKDTLTGVHYLLEENIDLLDKLEDSPSPIPPPAPQIDSEKEIPADDIAFDPLDSVTIEAMIVYTAAARSWAGGLSGINNIIAQAVAKGQLALDNSNTIMTVSLVYSGEISYTESGNSSTDLGRLRSTSDGYMDEVHTLRNQYGADVVGLFTQTTDTGGIGYLLNTSSGSPTYAFSITRVQQASWTYTYIHEMGHNMGCDHRKDQSTQPGPGLFSYSAGWHWIGNDSGMYASVMSYEDGGYSRVGYFSNPSIMYQGVATGHSADGDNARSLRTIKNVIANYRPATQTGSLSVTISPQGAIDAGAQWNVDGGGWQDSGATISDLPIGSHTVNPKTVSGWISPASESVTISSGATTAISLVFLQDCADIIGDFDNDCDVDYADLYSLAENWLWTGSDGSIAEDIAPQPGGDGMVNFFDFALFAKYWRVGFAAPPSGPKFYELTLDTDPGWTTEGLWGFGQPTGGGGSHGGSDPTSGHTGINVYGYNLDGDYENRLSETHLTSTAIDCSGQSNVHLKFWRWLGVENMTYDHAYVKVSNNGTDWVTVWENIGEVTDASWVQVDIDISSVADDQSIVYLRWTIGSTDSSWAFCGWNIDDVELWKTP